MADRRLYFVRYPVGVRGPFTTKRDGAHLILYTARTNVTFALARVFARAQHQPLSTPFLLAMHNWGRRNASAPMSPNATDSCCHSQTADAAIH